MVATPGAAKFRDVLPVRCSSGRKARGDTMVAYAAAESFQELEGLGLRCVMEQEMPNAASIAEALAASGRNAP